METSPAQKRMNEIARHVALRRAAQEQLARCEQVLGDLIRQASEEGYIGRGRGIESSSLARMLEVSRETVYAIRDGRTWK